MERAVWSISRAIFADLSSLSLPDSLFKPHKTVDNANRYGLVTLASNTHTHTHTNNKATTLTSLKESTERRKVSEQTIREHKFSFLN